MTVEYHPAVRRELTEAIRLYRAVSNRLEQEFKTEFRRIIAQALSNPTRFHSIKPGVHRANLQRFPYHVIYRPTAGGIRNLGWSESRFGRHGDILSRGPINKMVNLIAARIEKAVELLRGNALRSIHAGERPVCFFMMLLHGLRFIVLHTT